jgi:hypothetical protein
VLQDSGCAPLPCVPGCRRWLGPERTRCCCPLPQVTIQHYGHLNYWMVTIK